MPPGSPNAKPRPAVVKNVADEGDDECPAWHGVPDAMKRTVLKLIKRVPEEDENEEHKYQDRRDDRYAMRNVSNLYLDTISLQLVTFNPSARFEPSYSNTGSHVGQQFIGESLDVLLFSSAVGESVSVLQMPVLRKNGLRDWGCITLFFLMWSYCPTRALSDRRHPSALPHKGLRTDCVQEACMLLRETEGPGDVSLSSSAVDAVDGQSTD
ncbi:hypothetical protein F4604DRAFT_1905410 [Suillus subluteus]|nr:hypothetical protein F4604DRAFT_1905410 [Suillus subluteus]